VPPDDSTRQEILGYVSLLAGAGKRDDDEADRLDRQAASPAHPRPAARDRRETGPLVPQAIEEILRFEAPSPVAGRRYVARDVEVPRSNQCRKAASMLLLNGSANRDERRWRESRSLRHPARVEAAPGPSATASISASAPALARLEGRGGHSTRCFSGFPEWEVDWDEAVGRPARPRSRGWEQLPVVIG